MTDSPLIWQFMTSWYE